MTAPLRDQDLCIDAVLLRDALGQRTTFISDVHTASLTARVPVVGATLIAAAVLAITLDVAAPLGHLGALALAVRLVVPAAPPLWLRLALALLAAVAPAAAAEAPRGKILRKRH